MESALSVIPGVADLAVFGRPDDDWGQRVCAAFVLASEDNPPPVAAVAAALRQRASTHLAPYKRPKEYTAVAALPRTATGKVQRHLLGAAGGGSVKTPTTGVGNVANRQGWGILDR